MRPLNRLLASSVLLLSLALGAQLASASPLSSWSKKRLAQGFALGRHTSADRVLDVRGYDLKSVRDVAGFILGRHRSGHGKWTTAGVVFYVRCGQRFCLPSLSLGAADTLRGRQLVDLAAKETRIPHHVGYRVLEPTRRARRPLLLIQTERRDGSHLTRAVVMISLEDSKHPKKLLGLTTSSERLGESRPTRGRGRGIGRGRLPRFKGRSVTSMRFLQQPGKPITLEVMERRISTRFNRCREPEPRPTRYLLKGERFVMQFEKGGLPGCR